MIERNPQRPLRTLSLAGGLGVDEKRIRESVLCSADAVCFDLEDGVRAKDKPTMRELLREIIPECASQGPALFVRINDEKEEGEDAVRADLEAVVCPELYGILLPKVTGPEEMTKIAGLLDEYEVAKGVPRGQTLIMPLLETAEGNYRAFDIACSTPRAAYMGGISSFKGGDPAANIGFEWTPTADETLYIRQKVLLEARAAGIPYPLGAPWVLKNDLDGARAHALMHRREGYRGLLMPNPTQYAGYHFYIEMVNEVFAPSREEVAELREMVSAIEAIADSEDDRAYIFHGGRLVGISQLLYARERLELARQYGVEGAE